MHKHLHGLDPVSMKEALLANQKLRMVDAAGLYSAEKEYGDEGVVQGFRIIRRNDDTNNQNFNGLGIIQFEESGPCSVDGTSSQSVITHWLAGRVDPDNPVPAEVVDGKAEIEIETDRGWVNCANGQVNQELIIFINGDGQTTNPDV